MDLKLMQPADEELVRDAERSLAVRFPLEYRRFLLQHNGAHNPRSGLLIYGMPEIVERNQTWETQRYAPGFLAVGDDGGGRVLVLKLGVPDPAVFIVDSGSMSPDMMAPVAACWSDWERTDFPLPD